AVSAILLLQRCAALCASRAWHVHCVAGWSRSGPTTQSPGDRFRRPHQCVAPFEPLLARKPTPIASPTKNIRGMCRLGRAGFVLEIGQFWRPSMQANTEALVPDDQHARESSIRIPNESVEYRAARQALLAQEFELRRQIERVAAMRRALPPGGPVTGDYRFETEHGPSDLAGLFGNKQTLVVYNYMF